MSANHSLGQHLVERVGLWADIDTRRALGIPPGRLPRSELVPRPIKPTTFRYFPDLKKIIYINFDESYDVFCWEVYEDAVPMGTGAWIQGPSGRRRGVWEGLDGFITFDKPGPSLEFYFAGQPEIVIDETSFHD